MVQKIAVLASGGGSNFQAVIDSIESGFIKDAKIVVLISDKDDAYALKRAEKCNIEAVFADPKKYPKREDYDRNLIKLLESKQADLVVLAGYMRIVSIPLIKRFKDRLINIHPALLPSFPGLHGQKQALDYGVKVSGCTVHFVDEQVDHGPIIIQAAVPVLESDTEQTLSKRILDKEHVILSQAIKWFVEGKLTIDGRWVRVEGISQAGLGLRVL